MSTAVGSIDTDRKPLTPRGARRQREARVRFWRVFIVTAFFVVVLSANLYIGVVVMFAKFGNPFVVNKVPAHATVQVKRPMLDRTFCRSTVFDNTTAHAIAEKIERCEKPAAEQRVRAKTQFTWGGR